MNKKFASLGTALSRDEAKRVMGGDETVLEFDNGDGFAGCSAKCTDSSGKSYTVSCDGDICTAKDGVGCYAKTGVNTTSQKC